MKNMQDFYNWLTSKDGESNDSKRRLAGLTRVKANWIISSASFDPWWVWGAEAAPSEA
jgi:hypothetical protein